MATYTAGASALAVLALGFLLGQLLALACPQHASVLVRHEDRVGRIRVEAGQTPSAPPHPLFERQGPRSLDLGRSRFSFQITKSSHIWVNWGMDRTVRLKLQPTPEQARALLDTLTQFTQAFNDVCEYGWTNSERNGARLHHATYYTVKASTPGLVSDLVIQARVKATEAIKSAYTRQKQGRRVTQPRSQLCAARYNLHTYKVDWQACEANLSTTGGRMRIALAVPGYALKYVGKPNATADLVYRKGSFGLHVVVSLSDTQVADSGRVVGIDLGLNHPAVTSERAFLGKRRWKEVDRQYFRLKRALQSKGTKAARRHLRKLAGKQLRFHRPEQARSRY